MQQLIKAPLTDGQFAALAFFAFNVGSSAFQRSTLGRKVNREEHEFVPPEFMKWFRAGRRKLKRLVHRREAKARLCVDQRTSRAAT